VDLGHSACAAGVVAHMVDHSNETSTSSQPADRDADRDGSSSVLRRQVPRSGSESMGSESGERGGTSIPGHAAIRNATPWATMIHDFRRAQEYTVQACL